MTTLWKTGAALLAIVLAMAGCANRPAAADGKPAIVYIGSDGTQLWALAFDAGKLTPLGAVAEVQKPRWVAAHPALPRVYVAVDGSGKEGSVIAYAMDRSTGGLKPLNEQLSGGGGTTFLALDAPSMTLLVANFSGGSASTLTLNPDGSLGPLVSTVTSTGSGPHRRQASPHSHAVSIDPSGHYALVADMGADRVFVHRFDRATHTLAAVEGQAFATPPGSGPRRAVFGNSGRFVYVLNELSAEVMTLRWDAPRLTQVQSLPISSAGFTGTKSAAELAVSHDGRFVYIADRGEGTLLVYGIDAASGALSLLQRLPSGGEAPWAFDIDASGSWLLVANFRSSRLNLFSIDRATGRLADTGQAIESPGPVSVTFVTR